MEKQVIYRDRQELQAADLNNTQGWADEALRHMVADAVSSGRHYVGLAVSAASATEITVAAGRLYDGSTGSVYALESAQTLSLFSNLPLADQKWLAISVVGQEEETSLEPRDFLIDLQTREVEPQTVAMQRRRVATVHISQGLESPTPEKPSAPTGYTLLAHVLLSAAGIQEVAVATANVLPNLRSVDGRVTTVEGWISSAEPRIAHIVSDISGLAAGLTGRATVEQVVQLGIDMAKVKERLELPDDYVFYGADHFLDEAETDDTPGDYAAQLEEGLRFPESASGSAELSLLNPLDPAAVQSADGFLLPAYTEIARLSMTTRAGDVTINSYQYQTATVRRLTMARGRVRYGKVRTKSTSSAWWRSGQYDPVTGIFRRGDEVWVVDQELQEKVAGRIRHERRSRLWRDGFVEPYWAAVTTEHVVQGATLAQTFLSAQTGWMTSVELLFSTVAASGAVELMLCEAELGQPDLQAVLARVTMAQESLATGWNRIPWARPVYIEAGKRYALVIVSGGAHQISYTNGTEYTQGLLVYLQDGAFLAADVDRDLCLKLNFAKFSSPRAAVQLTPLQLAGGINDLDVLTEGFTPDGTELAFEYQLAGVWYPVREDTAGQLASSPALLPLRVVFVGTTDVMPGVRLTESVVKMARHAAAFVHYSSARTLGTPSDSITVRVLLEEYDEGAGHSCSLALMVSGSPVAPTSTKTEVVDGRSRWLEGRWTLGAPASSYGVKITGATTDPLVPYHVAERYDLAV